MKILSTERIGFAVVALLITLRNLAFVVACVVCVLLVLGSALPVSGTLSKSSCGGFKPETRTLCWRGLP